MLLLALALTGTKAFAADATAHPPAVRDNGDDASKEAGLYSSFVGLQYASIKPQNHWWYSTTPTNRRFADLCDSDFNGSNISGNETSIRFVGGDGDKHGVDARLAAEMTYLTEQVSRAYDQGTLALKHAYIGLNGGLGATWFVNDIVMPYFEVELLLPPIKNEVVMTSSAGRVSYKSDANEQAIGMYVGLGYGVDFRVWERTLLSLHIDHWGDGAGKVGTIHLGGGLEL